jgi:lipid II:glycine glycyltransferase (peptidoglycan interpeptide bridge formation enzyme)
MPELTVAEWEQFLSHFTDSHLLQTGAWGELKSAFGWEAVRLVDGQDASTGAQVLFRRLWLGFSLAYLPKGPVGAIPDACRPEHWQALWPVIDAVCRQRRAVLLKVEPDVWEPSQIVENELVTPVYPPKPPPGFRLSRHSIQPSRTLVVDLRGDEDQVLNRMKQKTRYNIRLALKKGVVVRTSADLDTFQRLMHVTGGRDGFGVHSLNYYRRAYELFYPRGECELLLAEYEGNPLAGLMLFAHGRRAWYFYGASADEHRETMPTYLLQWEAMRWARQLGCIEYDLWGVPDADEAILEANFTTRSSGLWGVYRFKRGFGGLLRRAGSPWDRVYQPTLYALYRWWANRRPAE